MYRCETRRGPGHSKKSTDSGSNFYYPIAIYSSRSVIVGTEMCMDCRDRQDRYPALENVKLRLTTFIDSTYSCNVTCYAVNVVS